MNRTSQFGAEALISELMREVWTVRLGLVPYEDARRLQKRARGRAARRRRARRAAAARAPARLHEGAPLDRRTSCRWARTGTGCRGSRSARPTAAGASPTTARASWSAIRSSSLRPYGDDVHEYVRRMERVMIAALGDSGSRPRSIDGLTGVWTPERRKIGSIGVHVSRGVTTHGFAINVNNDLQPFEWIVPCGIEALPDDLAGARARRRAGPGRVRDDRRATASARSTSGRRSRSTAERAAPSGSASRPRGVR